VTVPLLQFKLVEMDQPQEQLLAEITQQQHAKEDVTHNLKQIHVIAPKLQSENVDLDQPLKQLLAEIKLKIPAKTTVILKLQLHLHQLTFVIAKLNLLKNAETDQLLFILHAEIKKSSNVLRDVHHQLQVFNVQLPVMTKLIAPKILATF
jgi:hypothetical protein